MSEQSRNSCPSSPVNLRLKNSRGFEPLRAFVEEYLAAFTDWNDEIEFILAEDDKVAVVTRNMGTQKGQMGPWSATGKTACLTSINIHRFENENVAETWIR